MSSPNAQPPTSTPDVQLRSACSELERRLRAGESCRAEDLLATHPALASSDDLAVDLIWTEFVVRRQLGQRPRPEEWYDRFPQFQDRLRQRLHDQASVEESSPTQAGTEPEVPVPVPAEPPIPIGRPNRVGQRYELLEELGHGGMGVVHKARDLVLGRVVALKKVRGGRVSADDLRRFRREAQAVARLQHRHIVALYDFGEEEGEPFLTMAYASGGNLSGRLVDFTGDARVAATLLEKVARAVQAAHEAGIVHRDLKPSNILLDEEGEPLVSDFGLAKFLDPAEGDGPEMTYTGQWVGTLPYMAPEQVAGRGNRATPATDVWALGVILCELLTGHKPFAGKGEELARRIRHEEPTQPRVLWPNVDGGLETVTLKCLQKDAARRYPSAAALAEDLARWLRHEPITARPERWWQRSWQRFRRTAAPRFALAALLVLGVLGSGVFLFRPPRSSSPTENGAGDEAAVQALQNELAAGKPVTLLGPVGIPRYYRWRTEKQRPPLPAGGRGALELESWATSLVELLPDPQQTRYRLSAEVSHLSATNGWAGLYFGGDEVPTPDGPTLRFGTLAFAGQGEYAGQVRMEFVCYHESEVDGGLARGRWTVHTERLGPPAEQFPWHRVAVEVTPEKITAFWDGRLFCTWVRAEWVNGPERDTWWARQHPFPNSPPPEFPPGANSGCS
jgi:serine/threonine protein kinase